LKLHVQCTERRDVERKVPKNRRKDRDRTGRKEEEGGADGAIQRRNEREEWEGEIRERG
jgi:hypothetical protein